MRHASTADGTGGPLSRVARARSLRYRLAANYCGRDRSAEYADLLRSASDAGYELISVAELHARSNSEHLADRRWLVLRHDVDIGDVAGNMAFWEIERAIGAQSTFYFRLATAGAHAGLVRRLLGTGFEVGYHFEEGATVAKRHHLADRAAVFRRRDEIQALFRSNCASFRSRWSPDLKSVASHGDWINRRLAFTNNEFLSADLRSECGLLFEAYDRGLMDNVGVYVSDVAEPPRRWTAGYGLGDALRDARAPIYLLTHERNWHSSRWSNAQADAGRLVDGLRYRLRF